MAQARGGTEVVSGLKEGGLVSPKNVVIAALVGVVALLVAGGVAVAGHGIPDGDGVIHGCYKTDKKDEGKHGELRLVNDAEDCKNNETAISWDQEGAGADDHHNQQHAIDGADHTGALAHSALSGVTTSDHHVKTVDTNAATICASGFFLNGDGTCDALGGGGLSGYEIVSSTSTSGTRVLAAVCPGGKNVLGGGHTSNAFDVSVVFSRPSSDGSAWEAAVIRLVGVGTWDLTVHAICANVSP